MSKIILAIRILKAIYDIAKMIGASQAYAEVTKLRKVCDEQCKAELMEQAHKGGIGPI